MARGRRGGGGLGASWDRHWEATSGQLHRRDSARDDRERLEDERRERAEQQTSTWTPRASLPPFTGTVEGTNHVASFKTGGPNGDDTLIADGDYHDDREGFDAAHDHFGRWGGTSRGHYSGPGH